MQTLLNYSVVGEPSNQCPTGYLLDVEGHYCQGQHRFIVQHSLFLPYICCSTCHLCVRHIILVLW
jgi:hypothetical protein